MIDLPEALVASLEAVTSRPRSRDLLARAQELSRAYRGEHASGFRPVRTAEDAVAYAALGAPATYARAFGSLAMTPRRAPGFAPRTMLDLGTGPGTAIWAAAQIWPSLSTAVAIERESAMLGLALELARGAPEGLLRNVDWHEGSLPRDVPRGPFDLVTISHVLDELEPAHATGTVRSAWDACAGVLAVIEPGTPAGFTALVQARRELIALGARVLAPCPHSQRCPLTDAPHAEPPDWCHFSERAARTKTQIRVKSASLPWEDVGFSHVIVSRTPSEHVPFARVLRHPWHAKGRIDLKLCATDGLRSIAIHRKSPSWKLARKLEWGSALETEVDVSPGSPDDENASDE